MRQIGNDGALYRLSARFTVRDGQLITFLDGTVDKTSLRMIVPPGRVTVTMSDFTLSRSTDDGATFTPVDAVLASFNPAVIDARPGENTVKFEFLVRTPAVILSITFGVETRPSEIAGTFFISEATEFYSPYAGTAIPFRAFYTASKQEVGTIPATATTPRAVFCGYRSDRFAIEFLLDDDIGLLERLGAQFAGSTLRYEVRRQDPADLDPLGLQSLGMSIERPGNTITFERRTHALQPNDADGCPADPGQVGLEISLPFLQTTTLSNGRTGTLKGVANMTFIPPM